MSYYILEVKQIGCRYTQSPAVADLSFAVAAGSLVCLLGPSGCGKTTVLRAIAGFQDLFEGEIRLDDRCVSRPGYSVAPEKRRLGMVFQDHALFPHLRVDENVVAGLRGVPRRERARRGAELLDRVGLTPLAGRYPHELSGGQQQRVALARALAPNPALLLMDEPFSNLDSDLRVRLGYDVRDLLKQQQTTCVLVTHDQNDAFALAERVGVMSEGRILQWDTPYNLYHEPNSRFVADFIGEGVFLAGELLAPDAVQTELGVTTGNRAYPWPRGTRVDVLIRPDDIIPDARNAIVGRVLRKAFKGAEILYTLRLPTGATVLSLFPSHTDLEIGADVGVRLAADHLVAFERIGRV
jgi:iron(III) transport system ATP-binding protein